MKIFGDASRAKCTITYDKLDRVAYVRSDNVTVPRESAHAILTVPDSVVTTAGGAGIEASQTCDILVPSSSDLFHISSATDNHCHQRGERTGAGADPGHIRSA